jgi:hypothetical protein
MKFAWISVLPLWALALAPAGANPSPAPIPAAPPPSVAPAVTGGRTYDPCAMVSQQDVAAAAGVATDQVFAPKSPTKNECVWAVGNRLGVPGQQVALSLQTIDQVKQAHGLAKLTALIGALQRVPGVPVVNNPIVMRAFADAQVVANLGDRAGWKNGSLSVLKNELLFQVSVSGEPTDATALNVATSVAQSVLRHVQTP